MSEEKTKVWIHFKSGSVAEFVVDEFSTERNGFNQLVSMKWKNDKTDKRPLFVNLDDVSGIFMKPVTE